MPGKEPGPLFAMALASSLVTPTPAAADLARDLDFQSLQTARSTLNEALETLPAGQTAHWQVNGVAAGSIEPLRTWRSVSGHWCRAYRERLRMADGRSQILTATRCRTGDGRWQSPGDP